MECKNEHFRHILLFYFRKRKNAVQAAGDFSLKDEQRSSRPNEVYDDQIKAIIESNRHVTMIKHFFSRGWIDYGFANLKIEHKLVMKETCGVVGGRF